MKSDEYLEAVHKALASADAHIRDAAEKGVRVPNMSNTEIAIVQELMKLRQDIYFIRHTYPETI